VKYFYECFALLYIFLSYGPRDWENDVVATASYKCNLSTDTLLVALSLIPVAPYSKLLLVANGSY